MEDSIASDCRAVAVAKSLLRRDEASEEEDKDGSAEKDEEYKEDRNVVFALSEGGIHAYQVELVKESVAEGPNVPKYVQNCVGACFCRLEGITVGGVEKREGSGVLESQ